MAGTVARAPSVDVLPRYHTFGCMSDRDFALVRELEVAKPVDRVCYHGTITCSSENRFIHDLEKCLKWSEMIYRVARQAYLLILIHLR